MTRLLILIFTLNALMMPLTSAQGANVCDMMSGSSVSYVKTSNAMLSMPSAVLLMPDMNCDTHDCIACSSIQCVSSCATALAIPLVSSDGLILSVVLTKIQVQMGSSFFYSIVHPVNTPPPLV